jgi:hypothetical protein
MDDHTHISVLWGNGFATGYPMIWLINTLLMFALIAATVGFFQGRRGQQKTLFTECGIPHCS